MRHVTMKHSAVGFGFGVLGSWGCLTERINTNHCALLDGDVTCEERYGAERAFCQRASCGSTMGGDGCVPARPSSDACYSPCGGGVSLPDDASCIDDDSTSTTADPSGESTTTASASDSGTEETSTSTGTPPCTSNDECTDAAVPFCEPLSGECVACDGLADPDGACAGVDPLLPLCVGGACVACTPENPLVCDEQLLLCDGGTNACVPCTEHGQCGSGACELDVGTCFPDDFVVHVDGDGGQDYMDVATAVAAVGAGGYGVIVVHELDGAASYQDALVIDGGKHIALLAASGEAPIVQGTGGNPGVRVEGAGTVLYTEGLWVVGNTMGLGLRVNGALAWVDRSRIVQNSGGGVLAEAGAQLVLRNCFVGDGTNGDNALTVDGTTSMPSAEVVYTTLASGVDNFIDVFPVYCDGIVDVSIRNSLLVSFDNSIEIECPMATVTSTASEALIPGVGNSALGSVGADWFVDIDIGNFHLNNPPGMLATTAQWSTGDPLTDIDADPRPAVDGSPDYAGADVP